MARLSPLGLLKETDLGVSAKAALSKPTFLDAFKRLFGQLNPYFDGLNKLAAKGITFADNFRCDYIVAPFTHGVAQNVALKTLTKAQGVLVLGADSQIVAGATVQMVTGSASAGRNLAKVTVWFNSPAAAKVNVALLLLPEGQQSAAVPAVSGDGAWTAPTLLSGWVNLGAPYQPVGYFRDPGGFVHLRGTTSNAAGTAANVAIFTLPAGYRPSSRSIFGSWDGNGAGSAQRLDIDTAGNVFPTSAIPAGDFRSLDGITFDTR